MSYLISIVGPTAVGKSALAIHLAEKYRTHILSCDSRQIYRYMDIGTAKASIEERQQIPHHFIDILDPSQEYNAASFEKEALKTLQTIFEKHSLVIAVGGSTLYFHALWYGFDHMPPVDPSIRSQLRETYHQSGLTILLNQLKEVDPETYAHIDKQNHVRVIRALEVYFSSGKPISAFRKGYTPRSSNFQHIKIGLYVPRESLYDRINKRVDSMIRHGLEEEVRNILNMGYQPDIQALQSIGYQEMISYIQGNIDLEEAIRLIKRNSRRYAKRQLTYYRKFEDIKWFQASEATLIESWLENQFKSAR